MTKKVFVYGKYIGFEIPKPTECDYELITEEFEILKEILNSSSNFYRENGRAPTEEEFKFLTSNPEKISTYFFEKKDGTIAPSEAQIYDYIETLIREHSLPFDGEGKKGIYQITNKQTGKAYIGSSSDIAKRFRQHVSDSRSKTTSGKDGVFNFHQDFHLISEWKFEILEVLPKEATKSELLLKEKEYIERSDKELYNKVKPTTTNTVEEALRKENTKLNEKLYELNLAMAFSESLKDSLEKSLKDVKEENSFLRKTLFELETAISSKNIDEACKILDSFKAANFDRILKY